MDLLFKEHELTESLGVPPSVLKCSCACAPWQSLGLSALPRYLENIRFCKKESTSSNPQRYNSVDYCVPAVVDKLMFPLVKQLPHGGPFDRSVLREVKHHGWPNGMCIRAVP